MKRLLALMLFALGPAGLQAQPVPLIKTSNGAPTGGCGTNWLDVDYTTGNLYSCLHSVWVPVSAGAGGGVASVSGTPPIQSTGGTNPAISCPLCAVSTGSPSTAGTLPVSTDTAFTLGDSTLAEDITGTHALTPLKALFNQAVTVSFNAGAPNFDLSTAGIFTVTLTGNATATISNAAPVNGADPWFGIQVCQDTTGGWVYTPPAGFPPVAISPTASSCTRQLYSWDGTNAHPWAPAIPDDAGLLLYGPTRTRPPTPPPGSFACWADALTNQFQCVNSANVVTILTNAVSPTSGYQPNQPLSGCGIEYVSGLTFTVGACNYTIAGQTYNSPLTSLTLSAADATNPRIDQLAVDVIGTALVVPGTPSTPAVPANIDYSTQLSLTSITVAALATTPTGVATTLIYDENTEWTCTASANFNCASTNNPYHGTKDIEATTATLTNNVTLVKPAAGTVDLGTFNSFIFYIRSKATWPTGNNGANAAKNLSIFWKNGSTIKGNTVVLADGAFGFSSSNTTSYQQIAIPTSLFGIAGVAVTTVEFQVSGKSGASTIGFYVDEVSLQSGTPPTILPTTLMNWRGTYNITTAYNPNDVVVSSAGLSYLALLASTNVALTVTTTWQLISPITLASAAFANQGTTTTVLHGNASGNLSFGSVVAGDIGANAVGNAALAVVQTRRACIFDNDTQSSTALTAAQFSGHCIVPYAATIVEVDVSGGTQTLTGSATAPTFTGTSSIQIGKHGVTNNTALLSGALATASGVACALTSTSGTCLFNNAMTSSNSITISTTAILAGDELYVSAATADAAQTWYTVAVIFTVN